MADVDGTPPRLKTVKRSRYEQKFKPEYCSEFKFISKSRAGETYAFCTFCGLDICIAHGGRDDIKKHAGTKKHSTAEVTTSSQRSISGFTQPDRSLDVTRSELLFTSFLVEHNIAFAAADHAGQLFRKMFPDSDIAKRYGCGRTKTGCMIGELARSSQSKIAEVLSSGLTAFSVATDGSNDTESKLYPVVIRYHDPTTGRVDCCLLAVPNLTKDSTGENIADLIVETMAAHNIPWKNCIAFSSDNASVMTGRFKGCITYLKKLQPSLALVGCPCHLIHIGAEKTARMLPLSVEELLIDLYYYLDKSSKRIQTLRDFQELCNTETRKILKHVCTRWLSVGICLKRVLDQWELLTLFFEQQNEQSKKSSKVNVAKFDSKSLTVNKAAQSTRTTCAEDKQKRRQPTSSVSKMCSTSGTSSTFLQEQQRSDAIASEKMKPKKTATSQKVPQSEDRNVGDAKTDRQPATTATAREERILKVLQSKRSHVYALFVHFAVSTIFDPITTCIQSEEPLVHKLRRLLIDLCKDILSKFVKLTLLLLLVMTLLIWTVKMQQFIKTTLR